VLRRYAHDLFGVRHLVQLVEELLELPGRCHPEETPRWLFVGTMLLGGDLWFETFAIPWLADEAPAALDTDPTMVLAIGAIASYLSFAIGWALFGIASLRAHAFPKAIRAAIVVGGLLGFQALLAPFGIPIPLAIASAGRMDDQVEGVSADLHRQSRPRGLDAVRRPRASSHNPALSI
jgi:hypothetical protein